MNKGKDRSKSAEDEVGAHGDIQKYPSHSALAEESQDEESHGDLACGESHDGNRLRHPVDLGYVCSLFRVQVVKMSTAIVLGKHNP